MSSDAAVAGAPTSWIQRIRVPAGFGFGILFLLLARPETPWLVPGLLLVAAGAAVRTWAAGFLRKHQSLSSAGPYRWTRNPLYLGSFLIGAGFCIAASSPLVGGLFLVLFFSLYLPVMRREEAELEQAYGDKYRAYRERVPRVVPTGRRVHPAADENFSWGQVICNREHHTWIGIVSMTAYLCIQVFVIGR